MNGAPQQGTSTGRLDISKPNLSQLQEGKQFHFVLKDLSGTLITSLNLQDLHLHATKEGLHVRSPGNLDVFCHTAKIEIEYR